MATKAQWRAAGIANEHNLVRKFTEENGGIPGVYLDKSVNDGARYNQGKPTGYVVRRPGYQTDSTNNSIVGAPGQKVFYTYAYPDWDQTAAAAWTWANNRYKFEGPWVQIPGFGKSLFPQLIADWAKTYVKEASK